MIGFLVGFILGGLLGIATMCVVRVSGDCEMERDNNAE